MPRGTENFTLHDLRRTFETGLAELGIEQDVIDLLMNHVKRGMARTYNHSAKVAAKRQAAEMWDRHMRECFETFYATRTKRAA